MRYTIEGFSQKELINLKMDLIDAIILRWFIDFKDTGKMSYEIINNDKYYWVKYEAVLKDLPILNLEKRALARRFLKLSENNVLKHFTKREKGTFSMYAIGSDYSVLVGDDVANGSTLKSNGADSKVPGVVLESTRGWDSKVPPKDSSINYQSTKYHSLAEFDSDFIKFWDIYDKKVDKEKCMKAWSKLNAADKQVILEKVEDYVKSKPDLQYRKNPLTWLNGKCWNDEIEKKPAKKYKSALEMIYCP